MKNQESDMDWSVLGIIKIVVYFLLLVTLLVIGAALVSAEVSDLADIADFINNFTAPVLSLLGSVLLYLAFLQQIKNNRITQQQVDHGYDVTYFEYFLKCIDAWKGQSENVIKEYNPSANLAESYYMHVQNYVSKVNSSDNTTRPVNSMFLNGYCNAQSVVLGRVLSAANNAFENIKSPGLRNSLLFELDQFNNSIFDPSQITGLEGDVGIFVEHFPDIDFSGMGNFVRIFGSLRDVANRLRRRE